MNNLNYEGTKYEKYIVGSPKWNELNKNKVELETQIGMVKQEMLKIIGKIELLQDLEKINEPKKNKDNKST